MYIVKILSEKLKKIEKVLEFVSLDLCDYVFWVALLDNNLGQVWLTIQIAWIISLIRLSKSFLHLFSTRNAAVTP